MLFVDLGTVAPWHYIYFSQLDLSPILELSFFLIKCTSLSPNMIQNNGGWKKSEDVIKTNQDC